MGLPTGFSGAAGCILLAAVVRKEAQISPRSTRLGLLSHAVIPLMIEILHDFMYQNPRNDDSIVFLGSRRISVINSIMQGFESFHFPAEPASAPPCEALHQLHAALRLQIAQSSSYSHILLQAPLLSMYIYMYMCVYIYIVDINIYKYT